MSKREYYSMTLLIKSISSAQDAKLHFMTMTDVMHSDVVCPNAELVFALYASRTAVKMLMPISTLVMKVSRPRDNTISRRHKLD